MLSAAAAVTEHPFSNALAVGLMRMPQADPSACAEDKQKRR